MTECKKILIVAPTPYFAQRGCHVRIFEEARALKNKGHLVEIVTYHLGDDKGDFPIFRSLRIPWYQKRSAGPSWHKLYLDFFLFLTTLKRVIFFKPDVLHCHLHEGFCLGFFFRLFFRIPIVFDCQGSLTGELLDHQFISKGSVLYRIFYWIEKTIYQLCSVVLTSSSNTAEFIRSQFALEAGRIVPLIDAIDPNQFQVVRYSEEDFQQVGFPFDKKILMFVGVLSKYQGIDLLIESISELQNIREKEDYHFIVIGYPNQKYIELAAQAGISDQITFIEQVPYDRVGYFLNFADIALSPKISRTEANGKLFNYAACGLPCIVFDNPVNREILGDQAIYCSEETPQAYADQINESLECTLSFDAKCLSRQAFIDKNSWAVRISILEEIYLKLVDEA